MTGKQKCKILKEIRRQIAAQNDIRYVIEECRHQGNCRGTCPKCEWEVRMLESELEKRRKSGKKVVLAGISAGFLLTSCSPIDTVKELVRSVSGPLEGEPAYTETEMEEGEAVAEEVTAGILPPEDETENCEITEETEEEYLIAGGILPIDQEEEPVIEGDIWYPSPEEEELS